MDSVAKKIPLEKRAKSKLGRRDREAAKNTACSSVLVGKEMLLIR